MGAREIPGAVIRVSDKSEDRAGELKYTIRLELTGRDFERQLGRPAWNREEFEKWGQLCEKGLDEGYIDWDLTFEVARDALLNPNRYAPARR